MEDEIASMCAIVGASLTGKKVMTATSGPGFSLKQEAIGYACMTEIPCVIANVQRGGCQQETQPTSAKGILISRGGGPTVTNQSLLLLLPTIRMFLR